MEERRGEEEGGGSGGEEGRREGRREGREGRREGGDSCLHTSFGAYCDHAGGCGLGVWDLRLGTR